MYPHATSDTFASLHLPASACVAKPYKACAPWLDCRLQGVLSVPTLTTAPRGGRSASWTRRATRRGSITIDAMTGAVVGKTPL